MEVFTYKKFINIPLSERDTYLDKFYNGEPHRILAEVINLNNSYAEIKAMYLLIHGNVAQPFNFFPDKDLSTIKISGDLKKKLTVGKQIICTLRVRLPDAKGQIFTVRADEIDYNFEEIEHFYNRYGLTYDAKYIYEIFDGENLSAIIGGDFKDKLSDAVGNILAERDAEIAEKNFEFEKLKAEVDKEIEDKNSELQSLQEKISSAQIELEKLQTIKKFYGIDEEETFAEKISEELHEENYFSEYISYWQGHLAQVHGLIYRKEILESIHWGLHTNQLILLTGSPGTGKTSLVRALPKCFGWEDSAIIPVQANWTDKSDLLGYYNPIEKNYMSTPFLDALLKFCRKAENSNDIFIICLDEMNLAHVEHYFAEFLSVLQGDRVIRLYSDELRRDIYRELKYNAIVHSADDTEINFDERRFMNMNLEERKYYLQLCRMANMFFKYPATFEIPENIKFFGTLNQDATTLDISPKVIDRAFVIRVEKSDCEIKFDEKYKPCLYFDPIFFQIAYYSEFADIKEFFSLLNSVFPLSRRNTDTINFLFRVTYQLDYLPGDFFDLMVASFILPKIRFDAETDKEKISALKNLCERYPYSKEILEKYMTSPDGKEIDYWRA